MGIRLNKSGVYSLLDFKERLFQLCTKDQSDLSIIEYDELCKLDRIINHIQTNKVFYTEDFLYIQDAKYDNCLQDVKMYISARFPELQMKPIQRLVKKLYRANKIKLPNSKVYYFNI